MIRNILFTIWWQFSKMLCKFLALLHRGLNFLQYRAWKMRYGVANFIIDFGKPKEEEDQE